MYGLNDLALKFGSRGGFKLVRDRAWHVHVTPPNLPLKHVAYLENK